EMSGNQDLKFVINLSSEEYLSGHIIQEKIIFPATGYIFLAWRAFAKLLKANYEDLSIHLENICFKRITELLPNHNKEFRVSILNKSGDFEITENNEIVCSGVIQIARKISPDMLATDDSAKSKANILVQDDFYKILYLKEYDYQGLFRGVQNIDWDGSFAELKWNDNWICFLDTMLQIGILDLGSSLKELIVPVKLESAMMYPTIFKESFGGHHIT
ncbi:unnamed protein product, partial [Allacma fusca]